MIGKPHKPVGLKSCIFWDAFILSVLIMIGAVVWKALTT
jgi:hypothetical protein